MRIPRYVINAEADPVYLSAHPGIRDRPLHERREAARTWNANPILTARDVRAQRRDEARRRAADREADERRRRAWESIVDGSVQSATFPEGMDADELVRLFNRLGSMLTAPNSYLIIRMGLQYYTLTADRVGAVLSLITAEEAAEESTESDEQLLQAGLQGGFSVHVPAPDQRRGRPPRSASSNPVSLSQLEGAVGEDAAAEEDEWGFVAVNRNPVPQSIFEQRSGPRRSRRNRRENGGQFFPHLVNYKDPRVLEVLSTLGVFATIDPANYTRTALFKPWITSSRSLGTHIGRAL